ncbi:hypothetical protein ACJX0J_007185, partial [Zea mays]
YSIVYLKVQTIQNQLIIAVGHYLKIKNDITTDDVPNLLLLEMMGQSNIVIHSVPYYNKIIITSILLSLYEGKHLRRIEVFQNMYRFSFTDLASNLKVSNSYVKPYHFLFETNTNAKL